MHRHELSRADGTARRLEPEEIASNYRKSIELTPKTLESLVTWDVSAYAQCEKERMNRRVRGAFVGGY